jgi:hypothetical protein
MADNYLRDVQAQQQALNYLERDTITPEELAEIERIRQLAGGDGGVADPIRQYLGGRANRNNALALDDAMAGGIKTLGGLGISGLSGPSPPGVAVGGGLMLYGIADLIQALARRQKGRAAQEGADAFGRTGLPGRPYREGE